MASRVTPITRAKSLHASATRTAGERRAVLLLLPVVMLMIIGLGALLSASSVVGIRSAGGDQFFFVKRQVIFIGVGLIAFVVTVKLPYRWYARLAVPILVVALLGLVATLLIGEVRGGARRWIDLGPISVQTSEFAKFAVVAFLAATLSRKERWLESFAHVAVPVLVSLGSVSVLLLLQPDLGTTVLIAGAAFAVLAASAAPIRYLLLMGASGIVAVLALARSQPYRWERVTTFLNPDADPLGAGLQSFQSLVALGTGGWFGLGLGASRARWSFLPNAHTDFIFAIIGEETGLAGTLVVTALFVAFSIVGITIAMKAPDRLGRLLAVGIVAWLSFQALVNIGGVTRVMPITGVPLPFVSSGGSAMIVNLAVIGVLVNIARAAGRQQVEIDQ
jgi:cell division protein FtsW